MVTVGIDIGHETVKMVGLRKSGNRWLLQGMNLVDIPAGPWQADRIDHLPEIIGAIKAGLKAAKPHSIGGPRAMVALPESVIFSATFATHQLPGKELAEALPFEIAEKLSLNLDEYQIDYETLTTKCQPLESQISAPAKGQGLDGVNVKNKKVEDQPKDETTSGSQITVFAVAAKKSLIESVVELCKQTKLDLAGIDIKPGAIARSVVSQDDGKARLIVDMGVGGTGVSIAEGQSLRVTATVPWGTHTIAKKIEGPVEDLRVKASPVFDELVHVSKFFENRICPGLRLEEVIISGTGASIPNVAEVFQAETGLATKLAEPFKHVDTQGFKVPETMIHTFADSIGLAMRGIEQ